MSRTTSCGAELKLHKATTTSSRQRLDCDGHAVASALCPSPRAKTRSHFLLYTQKNQHCMFMTSTNTLIVTTHLAIIGQITIGQEDHTQSCTQQRDAGRELCCTTTLASAAAAAGSQEEWFSSSSTGYETRNAQRRQHQQAVASTMEQRPPQHNQQQELKQSSRWRSFHCSSGSSMAS